MSGNIYRDIPKELANELFETLVEKEGCRLERIVSLGHTTPDGQWYDQDWDEWVIVLKGKAALQLEGKNKLHEMYPGDYLLIPAHLRHRVAWTDPDGETVWIALHFGANSPQ